MEPLPVRFRVNGVQKSSVSIAYDELNRLSGSAMTVGTGATATMERECGKFTYAILL